MSRIELARELRRQIDANLAATRKLVRVDEIPEDELKEMIDLYPSYETDKNYAVGDVFKYDGRLYKVIQAHTSQEGWRPDATPALYLNLVPSSVIPLWVRPTGGHDAYNIGDKVIFEGKVYESLIDANVWSPTEYPAGWREL